MQEGEIYEMQRGPTCRPHRITLVSKCPPSGRSHYVLVKLEDGINRGLEKEVSSRSIHPIPGRNVERPRRRSRPKEPAPTVAPSGWLPRVGEPVVWSRTLGSRFTVLEVDRPRRVITIDGIVPGVEKTFEAPLSELAPWHQTLEVVHDATLEIGWKSTCRP